MKNIFKIFDDFEVFFKAYYEHIVWFFLLSIPNIYFLTLILVDLAILHKNFILFAIFSFASVITMYFVNLFLFKKDKINFLIAMFVFILSISPDNFNKGFLEIVYIHSIILYLLTFVFLFYKNFLKKISSSRYTLSFYLKHLLAILIVIQVVPILLTLLDPKLFVEFNKFFAGFNKDFLENLLHFIQTENKLLLVKACFIIILLAFFDILLYYRLIRRM